MFLAALPTTYATLEARDYILAELADEFFISALCRDKSDLLDAAGIERAQPFEQFLRSGCHCCVSHQLGRRETFLVWPEIQPMPIVQLQVVKIVRAQMLIHVRAVIGEN